MQVSILKERRAKVEMLQQSINIIHNEVKVRRPHPTTKTLFNGQTPKNRNNLKKLKIILPKENKKEKNEKPLRPTSIQQLITNSKNDEFLSIEKPNNFGHKVIPIKQFSSSSTLYSLKANQLTKNQNNTTNTISSNNQNIVNHTQNNNSNYEFLNTTESIPVLAEEKLSKMSQKKKSNISVQQAKDLNQLYQEYTENVSKKRIYNYIIYL